MSANDGKHDLKLIEEPKSAYVRFILEVCKMTGIPDNEKAEISTLAEFVFAQWAPADCRVAFPSFGKRHIHSNVIRDGVLYRVAFLNGTSQRVVTASLQPRFFYVFHYSLMDDHYGERRTY